MSERRWLGVATMLSAGILGMQFAGTAEAAASPTLALDLGRHRISEGATDRFSYSTHSASGGTLQLQRTFGTSRVFKTVKKLPDLNGNSTFTVPQMGAYKYRLALKNHSGQIVATSPSQALYSYGQISLGSLLHVSSHTVNIGGNLYRYVWQTDTSGARILHRDSTSCRSTHLTIGLKTFDSHYTPTGSVSIVQETADPVTGQAVLNQVVPMTAKLSGDAFNVTGHEHGYEGEIFVNGSFSCYTTNGKP